MHNPLGHNNLAIGLADMCIGLDDHVAQHRENHSNPASNRAHSALRLDPKSPWAGTPFLELDLQCG